MAWNPNTSTSYIKHINFLLYENISLINDSGIIRISSFLTNYIEKHHPLDNIIPVSQKQIANLVGLNTINTSRNLKNLKQLGIIDTRRNKILVKDLNKLKDFFYKAV